MQVWVKNVERLRKYGRNSCFFGGIERCDLDLEVRNQNVSMTFRLLIMYHHTEIVYSSSEDTVTNNHSCGLQPCYVDNG